MSNELPEELTEILYSLKDILTELAKYSLALEENMKVEIGEGGNGSIHYAYPARINESGNRLRNMIEKFNDD